MYWANIDRNHCIAVLIKHSVLSFFVLNPWQQGFIEIAHLFSCQWLLLLNWFFFLSSPCACERGKDTMHQPEQKFTVIAISSDSLFRCSSQPLGLDMHKRPLLLARQTPPSNRTNITGSHIYIHSMNGMCIRVWAYWQMMNRKQNRPRTDSDGGEANDGEQKK